MNWRRMAIGSLVIVSCVALSACAAPAESQLNSSNKDVTVEVVTHFDGLVLYRVDTGGRVVYVAARERSGAGIADLSTSWASHSGKSTRRYEVSTIER